MARLGSTLIRVLKPIVAGIGLAFLVTAFVDKPAPVHFQPDNPYAAKQEEIVETQADMVTEKNIMKLGSPLSVPADEGLKENNPLAALEELEAEESPGAAYTERTGDDNATEVRIEVEEPVMIETPVDVEETPTEAVQPEAAVDSTNATEIVPDTIVQESEPTDVAMPVQVDEPTELPAQ